MADKSGIKDNQTESTKIIKCSFCNKKQEEVKKLIAGTNVFICDECIVLCNHVMKEENNTNLNKNTKYIPSPKEIFNSLNDYIIGQNQTKKILSVAVHNHYKRLSYQSKKTEIELHKSNILLIGPTGCGKTLLAQTLAKILNVPFTIADATSLTEAGYVGEDVENIILRLLQSANYDIKKAERGIIYIDEIDKIAKKSDTPSITRDVSGEGVQQALLKIMEGTIASIPPQRERKHSKQELLQVNTTNILFMCSGAFTGIEQIISERSEKSSIGFNNNIINKDTIKDEKIFTKLKTKDLLKFGLIPEFIGRLPIITTLEDLNEETLINILKKPKNALIKQYQEIFKMENINLDFDEKALSSIAKKAIVRQTGARGLRSIMEEILLDLMYEIPGKMNIKNITITKDVIEKKSLPLIKYI